jgi:hypothetical protein
VKRKQQHKTACKAFTDRKIYKMMNANGGWDNWEIIEIEKYPCADSNEARKRERYYYEQLNATMNNNNPNRSRKEWEIENGDKIKANRKVKYYCPSCECEIVRISRKTHDSTAKHKLNEIL